MEPSLPFLAIFILPRYVHVIDLSVTSATPPPSTGFLDSSACTVLYLTVVEALFRLRGNLGTLAHFLYLLRPAPLPYPDGPTTFNGLRP